MLPLAGCQSASSPAGKRPLVATELAANLAGYSVKKVAMLEMVNSSGEAKALQIVPFVYAALQEAGLVQFAKPDAYVRDAERSGVGAELKKAQTVWDKTRALTRADVEPLLTATGHDALLAYEVTHWQEDKVGLTQEGTSKTQVGLKMAMYAPDGTLLWKGSSLKLAESVPYNPSLNVKATEQGEAIYDESRVPLPPPILPVAQVLASEVVATMPAIPPAAAPGS